MANFKVVVSDPKSRKAYQKEVDQNASGLMGKKIGDKISGSFLDAQGYELEITGGSDNDGFPMRGDMEGTARKRILLSSAPGFHPRMKGQRKRKSLRGNTISADISQVNTKVIKYGKEAIEKLLGAKKEGKAEKKPVEKLEEKPAEAKEQPKEEAKPKEEKPEANIEEEEKKEPKAEGKKELQRPAEAEKKPEAAEAEKRPEEKMGIKELETQEKEQSEKKEQKPEEKKKE